ncbi:hypothetical protein DFJ58DRAFT_158786 [Suillus subalutaceus]|uniref:uncharacterized protein n=1 Tax=Suillus subalutaceus TaxID=48586 RepID=UPI001B85F023|nr:uncharacterized protein DFJ58DRAFT_158786 [Suillus subalutaceus]KAG1836950.1 hypothetical protein DFJ58DRAFT_158786 [Suillus subalutaceus]
MMSKQFLRSTALCMVAHSTPHGTPAPTTPSNVTHSIGSRTKHNLRRKVCAARTEPYNSCSSTFPSFTRIVAAKFPEYIKVDDTRSPLRQQLAMSQDMAHDHSSSESSDVDSLPDVHWCKAFFCYYSCWSHGRLRMPPRWRLERVDPHQDGTTRAGRGGTHCHS